MEKFTQINKIHSTELGNLKSPSLFIKEDDYFILNLRFLKQTSEGFENISRSFLHYEQQLYIVENEKSECLEGPKALYFKLKLDLNYLIEIVNHYSDSVEIIEDQLFARTNLRTLNSEIFNLKRDVLKISRVLERLNIVLIDFVRKEQLLLNNYQSEFNDLTVDTDLGIRISKSLLEKLDTSFGYLNSLKNDNLNNNIYVLSVISGVFLPLNLIVGFFGMNTTGLFLSNHANGTQIVFIIIVSIFTFLFIGFPVLHFLDKKIVSRIFGRSSVYSKLSKRLEKVTDDFNILSD